MWIKQRRNFFKRVTLLLICLFITLPNQPAYGCISEQINDLDWECHKIDLQITARDAEILLIRLYINIANDSILVYERWIAQWYKDLAYYKGIGNIEKVKEMEAKIKDAEETIKRVKKQIADYDKEIQKVLDIIKKLYTRLGEIKAKIKKLEGQLANLDVKIARKKIDITHLKKELESLESKLDSETDCGEIEKLKSKISAKKNEISKAEEKLEALHAEHGC